MRIAFSGAQNTGKSTLVKDFLTVWPQYKTLDTTYRLIIKDNGLTHSSKTTVETQTLVRDWMCGELSKNKLGDTIVYDRCPLDNLVYTLWAFHRKYDGIDGKFVDESIDKMKESMRKLDIIFYIPADKCNFGVVNDAFRDTNIAYRKEIDQLFKMLISEYNENYDANVFFPKGDSPAIIELSGTREQRLLAISDYIDLDGNLHGEDKSIFSSEQLTLMETVLREQQEQKAVEDKEAEQNLIKLR
jgi:hypothetical protein